MARSWVYCNGQVYELVMLGLYGRHYGARYRAVADLIPDGASVLDLCCGPGVLFDRHLRARSVDYTGIDVNPRFIARVNRRGGRGFPRSKDGRCPRFSHLTVAIERTSRSGQDGLKVRLRILIRLETPRSCRLHPKAV
jgi:SAM-dependent methyltransferase